MKIALLAGGRTAEREGTLGSARQLKTTAVELGWESDLVELPENQSGIERVSTILRACEADVVIPLISGAEGVLSFAEVPYVGSSPAAAGIAAHKGIFNDLLRPHGLKTIDYVYGSHSDELVAEALDRLGLPVFVKPARLGASYGITRVAFRGDLEKAILTAAEHDPVVLVEQSVARPFYEYEIPLIIGATVTAASLARIQLPRTSIWHDTKSKYSLDVTFAGLESGDLHDALVNAAKLAAEVAGVSGAARVDMFVDASGSINVGEINAVPGHGAASTFPRIFELAGVGRAEQLSLMVSAAFERAAMVRKERFAA